jgi:hypothetical protein
MKVTWANSDQHTEWGLFRVGDVIDTTERGIPDEVISSWTQDGFAVEVKLSAKSEKLKKLIKVIKEA